MTTSFSSSLPSPSARRQAEGSGRLRPAPGCHGDAGHFGERAASHLACVGSHLPSGRGGGLQRYVPPALLPWAAGCLSMRWGGGSLPLSACRAALCEALCRVRHRRRKWLGLSSKPSRAALSSRTFGGDGDALCPHCPAQEPLPARGCRALETQLVRLRK